MIRAEPSLNIDGGNVWYGQYCTGRFWHTVRDDDVKAVNFATKTDAVKSARREWWAHVTPRAHAGQGVRYHDIRKTPRQKSRKTNRRISKKSRAVSEAQAVA